MLAGTPRNCLAGQKGQNSDFCFQMSFNVITNGSALSPNDKTFPHRVSDPHLLQRIPDFMGGIDLALAVGLHST
jgi:hypothetical protein